MLHVGTQDGAPQIELVPFFSPSHHNYTAMVPSEVRGVTVSLLDCKGMKAFLFHGAGCGDGTKFSNRDCLQQGASSFISLEGKNKLCKLQVRLSKLFSER